METKSDTRQLILEAALMLFSEKGFSATTTREIAQKAGFAEGTLFRYFPTKKDILIALAKPPALEELHKVMSSLSNLDVEESLKRILENRLTTFEKNKNLVKVIFTESQFHEEIREQLFQNIGVHVFDTIGRFLEEKIEEGVFRSADPLIITRILAGMMVSLVLSENFLPIKDFDEEKRCDYKKEIINIFLYGLKNREV